VDEGKPEETARARNQNRRPGKGRGRWPFAQEMGKIVGDYSAGLDIRTGHGPHPIAPPWKLRHDFFPVAPRRRLFKE
jgi:hypothetical protein